MSLWMFVVSRKHVSTKDRLTRVSPVLQYIGKGSL